MKRLAAVWVCALVTCGTALAQDAYPTKPVTIVPPFPPGGTSDLTARALAPVLERIFKQSVIVQNRPGAAGATGAQFAANSPPDGHTLILHLVSISALPERDKLFGTKPAYTRDQFIGISRLTADPPMLVVHPSLPSRNLKEFVALAKKHAGELIYSFSGPYGASLRSASVKTHTPSSAPASTSLVMVSLLPQQSLLTFRPHAMTD